MLGGRLELHSAVTILPPSGTTIAAPSVDEIDGAECLWRVMVPEHAVVRAYLNLRAIIEVTGVKSREVCTATAAILGNYTNLLYTVKMKSLLKGGVGWGLFHGTERNAGL